MPLKTNLAAVAAFSLVSLTTALPVNATDLQVLSLNSSTPLVDSLRKLLPSASCGTTNLWAPPYNSTLAEDDHGQWITVDMYIHSFFLDEVNEHAQRILVNYRDVDDAKALLHLMNKAFKPAKIQFKMIYITPTFDNELGSLRPDDTGSNKRLKQYYNGGFDSLNLYLFGAPGHYQPGLGVTSGVTNYPLLVPGEPGYGEVWTYSVFTTAFSMTDGPSGAAVIHEVGHWFGLPHTFDLDQFEDTPYACQPSLDDKSHGDHPHVMCNGVAGEEEADNFMDYAPMHNKTRSTPMQYAAMRKFWFEHRKNGPRP